MSLFPTTARFLEQVKNRLPIEAVIGKRLKIERRGREYTALCPFHEEKTPSFWISPQKGFYHCFGCGAHGDALKFIQDYEKRSFKDALEVLSSEAGIPLPRLTPQEAAKAQQNQTLETAMNAAQRWFESQLYSPMGAEARLYLARRGFTEEIIRRFGLGLAPDKYEGLKSALTAEKYSIDTLTEAGLLIAVDGKAPYDRFRGRLVIPIKDRRGQVIAFGGRALKPDQEPKYLNSPETPLFHKGSNLYAQDAAFAAMNKSGTALVVEGYFDAIALHQAGITHVVAPLGTAMTEEQIRTLWHQVDTVQLCFDGDKAGAKATWRAVQRALPHLKTGKTLQFLALPPGEDPDTLVLKGGAAAFTSIIEHAQSLSQFIYSWTVAEHGADTPEQKAACLAAFQETTDTIGDAVLKRLMLQELKDRFYQETRPAPRAKGARFEKNAPKNINTAPLPRPDSFLLRAQRALMVTLCIHPFLVDEVAETLAQLELLDKELDSARDALLSATVEPSAVMHTILGFQTNDRLLASLQQEWPFTKPQTSSDEVRSAWLALANSMLAEVVAAELRPKRRLFRF